MLPLGNGKYLITKKDYNTLNELSEVVFNYHVDFHNATIDFNNYKLDIPELNIYTYFDCLSEDEFLELIPISIK